MRLVLLSVLLVVSNTPTFAGQTWAWSEKDLKAIAVLERSVTKRGERHVVETPHWVIESDVSVRFTAELAHFMDKFSLGFDRLIKGLHSGKKVLRKPTAIVFDKQSDYDKKFTGGSRGHFRYHYTLEGFAELHVYSFIAVEKERDFKFFNHPILVHEGTHLLMRTYIGQPDVPLWFNEGTATYFQFWDLSTSGERNLKTRYSRSGFRKTLKEEYTKRPPSLRGLFSVETWNPDRMGPIAHRNYALGESIVDFMLSSKAGRRIFRRSFERVLSGQELFTDEEITILEPGWHKHIRATMSLKR